jgi:hypothetical protein
MNDKPKFLAEGAYGCVHRPSLRCSEDTKMNYKDKISKIMPDSEAIKELKEYTLIENADKNKEFYLGTPETCDFENSKINIPAVKKCENGKKILKKTDNFKLLIMPDGGDNLEVFAKKMNRLPINKKNTNTMEQFWIEAKRLLYGIKTFTKYGLIHHDLKPQNIVYDIKKNRCNFIDFGIMEKLETSKKQAIDNEYWFAIYHWNFVIEGEFLHNRIFSEFLSFNTNKRNEKIRRFIEVNETHLNTFFTYVGKNAVERSKYLLVLSNFLLNDIDDFSFSNFVDKSFHTFDLYGLGMTLLHVLKSTKHLTDAKLYLQLDGLFNEMISPNLKKRIYIQEAIDKYEKILSETAGETKSKYQNINQLEEDIKLLVKDMKKDSVNVEKIAEMDPVPKKIMIKIKVKKTINTEKKCPEGKVLNKTTNRCNTIKIQKNKTEKKCPEGKVLNKTTNRCNIIKK